MSAPVSTTSGFVVKSWRKLEKSSLRGFCSIELPSKMIIHNVAFHERDGSSWVSLPSEKYQKPGGETAYKPIIEFGSTEAKRKFQEQATAAVAQYLESQR